MLDYLSSINFTNPDSMVYIVFIIVNMAYYYHCHCEREAMYTITSNLKQLVRELNAQAGKDYDLSAVAKKTGLSRFTVSSIANNNNVRVDYGTLAKLLWFFHQEGMPITISDLFTVIPPGHIGDVTLDARGTAGAEAARRDG